MAFLSLMLLLFHSPFLIQLIAGHNLSHIISPGSSLFSSAQPTSWSSPSGHFNFGFYPQGDGFAVGMWLVSQPENTVIWAANRDDPPVSTNATLELTTNGKLLLRTMQGEERLIADVSDPADSATVLDSGNFILYRNSTVVWQSFDFPTDTLLGGQHLSTDGRLVSSKLSSDHSSGGFMISLQEDGNLVAYPLNSSYASDDAYWSSFTPNSDFSMLHLDYNGSLFLTNDATVKILANSSYHNSKKTVIYRATLDPDGIFRLYSHHLQVGATPVVSIQWSAMKNQCDVKGFCGFNSYCSSRGDRADCYCYPGFVPRNQTRKLLSSCSQNFTVDVCSKDEKIVYNMASVENTWWADYPYFVATQITKEDCSRSCQEDCNCRAAIYGDLKCNKHKLPLRYGRRDENMSTATAFFKVILAISSDSSPTSLQPKIINDNMGTLTLQPKIINDNMGTLIVILATSLGSMACLCLLLAVSSFFMYRGRVHRYRKLSENAKLELGEECTLQSFSYNHLEKATNGFKQKLGRGNYGAIYKGAMPGGKTVVVKRLEKVTGQEERAFLAEMMTIGRTHHRNLIHMLGFCVEGTRKLLVYEHMTNGSLADILFKAGIGTRPCWRERIRIAIEVARGIHYLHEECEVPIIHCNIKPQNILVDDSWTAKISDFGLAKLIVPNQTEINTGIIVTRSYMAPEWQRNPLASTKADVYSFGVVLLEIICCRSSIEINVEDADQIILSTWVCNCFAAGELGKLVADDDVDLQTLERMVKVGLWCIQDDPAMRPSIKKVILMMEGTMEVPVPQSN